MDPSLLQPTQMTTDEFSILESKVYSESSISGLEDIWNALHANFSEATPEYDRTYVWTFFALYANLSWGHIYRLSEDEVRDTVIARMVPMACIRGIDVPKKLSRYIRTKGALESDIVNMFLDIKEVFNTSQCIVGVDEHGPKTLQQVIQEAEPIIQGKVNSIETAEFYTALQELMLPKKDEAEWGQYIAETPARAVQNLMEVISFFHAGNKENIWYMIDSIIYPDMEYAVDESEEPPQEPQQNPQEGEQKPQILETIIATAQKMDETKPETILVYLDEQAELHEDDRIRDLYYFNEQTNTFEWNTDLLSESS